MKTLLSLLLLAGAAEAQLPFPGPNILAFDIFGLIELLQRFNIFARVINNGCRTVPSVQNFDANAVFSRNYFVQMSQPGLRFNLENQFNCVFLEVIPTDGLPNGYSFTQSNFAIDDDGEFIGAVDRSVDPPVVSVAGSRLCLAPLATNPSKFLSNLCDLPSFLGIDFWVVAAEPDFIITIGGQPTIRNPDDGTCSNDTSGFGAGIFISTADRVPSSAVMQAALDRAQALGLDTSVLEVVDQDNSGGPGPACDTLNTPRGNPIS